MSGRRTLVLFRKNLLRRIFVSFETSMDFLTKLEKLQGKNNSLLCVGLDPDFEKLENEKNQFEFNKKIIDETADYVCCFKPQIAFYAAAGLQGLENLKKTIDYIKKRYPEIPVLLDAKRGDVGHTSEMYVKEIFDFYGVDAVTLNPYCGFDAVKPFVKRKEKGVFIICRTSNPSSVDFQDLSSNGEPLFLKVAKKIVEWSKNYPNAMLQIGATWPKEIKIVRNITPDMIFLTAGVGAQGGDLKATLVNGLRQDGRGLIVSVSRSIIYGQNPANAAKDLKDEINKYR